jgi:hypothetical protein
LRDVDAYRRRVHPERTNEAPWKSEVAVRDLDAYRPSGRSGAREGGDLEGLAGTLHARRRTVRTLIDCAQWTLPKSESVLTE